MRVRREIDSGGFGRVHEVLDTDGHVYARKSFDPHATVLQDPVLLAKARARFVREANTQAQLSHPNIMPIVRRGLGDDPPWFLMPLADEEYRAQIMRDRRSGQVTLAPLIDILAGLEELHRLGYVHRDLKPENVLRLGTSWVISDLGLIAPLYENRTNVTSTGSTWGTERYAAPETVSDFRSATPRADIYSLGCILHDLATDTQRIPYQRHSEPGPLGYIIEKCTEVRPEDRFPNVASLRSALVSVLANPHLSASSPAVAEWIDEISRGAPSLSADEWRGIVRFLETSREPADAESIRRAIDVAALEQVHQLSPPLFTRLASHLCDWISGQGFPFEYCDILGARLQSMFDLGGTATKAESVMAALELACSHNRWSVMHRFVAMAGPSISDDLADRLRIDLYSRDCEAVRNVQQMEQVVRAHRSRLHPKLISAINDLEQRCEEMWARARDDLPF